MNPTRSEAMRVLAATLLLLLLAISRAAHAQGTRAPEDAYVYIISPADGETIAGAFWCRFGLRNMGITHSGDNFANSGHHHLFIDVDDSIAPGELIPHDRRHLHYAGGETEALVELPPGKHTLQLVLGDSEHLGFNPPLVSRKITIIVRPGDSDVKPRERVVRHRPRIRHHMRAHGPKPHKPTELTEHGQPKPFEFFSYLLNRTR